MLHLITKTAATAAVGIVCMGALAGTAAGSPAEPSGSATAQSTSKASWDIDEDARKDPKDKGGVTIYEQASKDGTDEYVMGRFRAYGETLSIWDHHDNGRKSIVKLWVGDSGPAVFYSNGDGTHRKVGLSYDEGQTVYLQACTSTSANAVCTEKIAKGRT